MEDRILSEHITADHQAKFQQEKTLETKRYYITSLSTRLFQLRIV